VANELTDLIIKVNQFVQSDRNIRTAISTTLAIHKPRIFVQGLDAAGNQIGTYSKNPISISTKSQARNTGKTYFKGGYAEYHGAIGKGSDKVNLRNTDQMYADYGVVGGNGKYGFGFQNNENYNKSQWMEEKYKKEIFELSDKELDVLADVLVDQLSKFL
jgi:hypothetical protein